MQNHEWMDGWMDGFLWCDSMRYEEHELNHWLSDTCFLLAAMHGLNKKIADAG